MRAVTFSRNVFIPLSMSCRNRCSYCGFRVDRPHLMRPGEVEGLLRKASEAKEALFTTGERPDEAWREVRGWLVKEGYGDFVGYLASMNQLAIKHGLLPHTNAGCLSYEELKRLKPFNASMGLMLEQAVELECHSQSPGKKPSVRIKTIKDAGRLSIPFTTGILIGIGETEYDRLYSLEVIADIHANYGHIQEVIVQGFKPKPGTPMQNAKPPSHEELLKAVKAAREVLPSDVAVQIPPNLVDDVYPFIKAGASDLGGISEVTPDYVNPEAPWPSIEEVRKQLRGEFYLRERLPVHPKFVLLKLYGEAVEWLVERFADGEGYVRRGVA
ncbi:MAG: 7,8-didemethyl-8-hydroxy-5-deazariboflavin synthase subunit CofG [Thermoprotei archaeon]|nr:MAG: 7,8-didemethyl-8-hydroxy-5-deazariboflavin synthase subunit CofG [Thermoprotei archaeon]